MSGCGTDWGVFLKTLIISSSEILRTGSELFQTSSELISTGSELIRTIAEQILTIAHRVVQTTIGRWKNRLIIFIYFYLLNGLLFNIYGKWTGEDCNPTLTLKRKIGLFSRQSVPETLDNQYSVWR
jgi:hypothetical protein